MEKDKELGLFLWKFYDNDELSSDDKNKLFNFAEANGLIKDFKIGDFEYKVISRGEVSAKYLGSASNVVFPSSVSDEEGNEYSVIEVLGVDNKNSLVSVEIPSSVKKISNEAFVDCKKLTTVKVPESVSLGYHSFANCQNLNYFKVYELEATNYPKSNTALRNYLTMAPNSPKILSKTGKDLEATFEDTDKLITFTNDIMINHESGYSSVGVLGKNEEIKNLGADILRRLAAKGNVSAMTSICISFLDNEREGAFKDSEFVEYAKRIVSKKPALGYYFLGLAYEIGIGVKPSRSTAHSYYAKGRELNDSNCDEGWWRTL